MKAPRISSQRLELRVITISDLEWIHQLHSYPEVDEFNTLGIPENIEETESIITPWIEANQSENPQKYTFAITSNQQEFIGLFGLNLGTPKFKSAEIWYKLLPQHWGNGYATEAVKAVLSFGFEHLRLHRITAGCAVDNTGSINVLEKCGMTREGRSRKILPLKSGWSDNFVYSILRDD
ncbi:MAG: GNAT family N-acetyltransferase [Flavobacteriales bacterium]|nr:GNAT family N-acetyltransferase [Flavobacteriales bacterium]